MGANNKHIFLRWSPRIILTLLPSLLALIFLFKHAASPPVRISPDDTLNYLRTRQKLISLPYDRLLRLKKGIENNSSAASLGRLLNRVMYEEQINNMLPFDEDIIIDNQPLSVESPFYENAKNNLNITNLKPYAEHLYFYNLKLEYKKNNLIKKNERLWINPRLAGKKGPANPPEKIPRFDLGKIPREARKDFSYRLRDDNQSDFFFFLRQWFKKYEEGQVYPVIYNNNIIVRNEYRLFCIDISAGREKWSFGDLDGSGQEFYQTFRHPHQNSYGYELLLASGVIFTELDHKFIAVKIGDDLGPRFVWQRDLGEYTVCAKPVKFGENIIVGLINARMELWICAFNSGNGDLKWSTYIGTSAFLSPACSVSLTEGGRVCIGTNHGVLICLDPSNGEIAWLRKYAPKKYSIFDYILKKHYEDSLSNKRSLRYDTQFMDSNKYGDICYKPRESDSFYILSSGSGLIKEEILVDPEYYYFLRMYQDKLVFLEKDTGVPGSFELKVIKAGSGKQIYKRVIKGASLKGVYYVNNEVIAFKIGRVVYFLSISGADMNLVEVNVSQDGWLVYADDKHLLFEDKWELVCFDMQNKLKREPKNVARPAVDNPGIQAGPLVRPAISEKKMPGERADLKDYHVQGEKIEILPVRVIKGRTPLDFFLVLNLDQLLCVDEKGRIIWQRKVFYNNREYIYDDIVAHDTDINKGRIFAADIEAYLFEGALIINDRVNVIAVNANDGSYLWSMTNKSPILEEEKIRFKQLGSFFRTYGYQASYLQNIYFDAAFLEGRIIITHGNRIYSVNPLSGVCDKSATLDIEGILQLYAWGKNIYVLPSSLDKIIIADKGLKIEKVINLDFRGGKENYAELKFTPGTIFVKTNSGVSIIGRDRIMREGLRTSGERFYAEGIGNNLLVVYPFSRAICYDVKSGALSKKWEFGADPLEPDTLWKGFSKKTKFYYIIGDKLIFISKKNLCYSIVKLDLKTGKREWESRLEGAEGVFYNLSDYQNINGAISFIITTACGESCDKDLAALKYVNNVILDSNLFQVDFLSGEVRRKQKLQSMMNHDFGDIASVQTDNYFIYEVYSKFLNAEIKNK